MNPYRPHSLLSSLSPVLRDQNDYAALVGMVWPIVFLMNLPVPVAGLFASPLAGDNTSVVLIVIASICAATWTVSVSYPAIGERMIVGATILSAAQFFPALYRSVHSIGFDVASVVVGAARGAEPLAFDELTTTLEAIVYVFAGAWILLFVSLVTGSMVLMLTGPIIKRITDRYRIEW